jgi:proline dehydrogenase
VYTNSLGKKTRIDDPISDRQPFLIGSRYTHLMSVAHPWSVPDLGSALTRADERRRQQIRCSLAALDEYVKTPGDAFRSTTGNVACLRGIAARQLDAALSVKLTALGAVFDRNLCMENLRLITAEAARLRIPLEIDMEGRGLVEFTLDAARACRVVHDQVTIALQAYLDRTRSDLADMSNSEIGVRLVKGAYIGDTTDFSAIQERFRAIANTTIGRDQPFSAGTHDPELVSWLRERMADHRNQIEFGFLMGLGDQTKLDLVADGWSVTEYVPFGPEETAYTARREAYIRSLREIGRKPVP